MSHLVRNLFCLVVGALVFSSTTAAAPAAVGYVQAVTGSAWLNGERLVPHTTLFAGDRLNTEDRARVMIGLPGAGSAVLDARTVATLARTPEGIELGLNRGRALVQQLPGGRLRVRAGDSEILLRSTGSRSALCEIALREAGASVQCPQGEASIVAAAGGGPVVVPAGYRAVRGEAAREAQAAAGGQRAGRVDAVIPQTNIERGAQALAAAQNSEVLWNDLVRTERRGRARLGLDDGSILSVGSDSNLRVIQHDAATRFTNLELKVGRMLAEVPKLGPQGKFQVRTSTAVLGVIGTRFFVLATPTSTTVVVYEGVVQVSSIVATIVGQTQVGVGQQSVINANQAPSAASPTQITQPTAVNQTAIQTAATAATRAWVLVPTVAGAVVAAVVVPTVIDDEPVSPSAPPPHVD